MAKKYSKEQIEEALPDYKGWSINPNDQIEKTYEFKTFASAILFVNAVAQRSEMLNHHPDILVLFNKVTLSLSTHDAGGVTEKDFELAQETDSLIAKP
ncbi:MAG: 4a-hydroxytetrahydrobiopterin dehydratase [Bdellovibrionales bacterium]